MIPSPAEVQAYIDDRLADERALAAETGTAVYVAEAEMWAALALAWDGALRPVLSLVLAILDADGDGEVTDGEVDAAREALAAAIETAFVSQALATALPFLAIGLRLGRTEAGEENAVTRWRQVQQRSAGLERRRGIGVGVAAGSPRNPVGDARALAWLRRDAAFWITTASGRRFVPAIARAAEQAARGEGSRADVAGRLQAAFEGVYDAGFSYWRVVASAAITRSQHWGRLSAYDEAGVEEVVESAVLDARTSEVCEYLNGKSWRLADLLAERDAVLSAGDPEVVRQISPWWSDADVPEIRRRVEANGGYVPRSVGSPQHHGHCRTLLVARPPDRYERLLRGL